MSSESFHPLFADVIVPVPVPGMFTYRVPKKLEKDIMTGQRVIVQFGAKKIYAGIIRRIHSTLPSATAVKYILDILDETAILGEQQLVFWDWICQYYMCFPGEVMTAALPSALKLSSSSAIGLHPGFSIDTHALSDHEFLIIEALDIQHRLTLDEVSKILGFKKIMPLVKTMIEKSYILMEETLNEQYKPKQERVVLISEEYKDEEKLSLLMDQLGKRAYKQMELLMVYLAETQFPLKKARAVPVATLLKRAKASNNQLKALEDKGVFSIDTMTVSRLPSYTSSVSPDTIQLTPHQQEGLDQIKEQFKLHQVVLLHGITSSGKTELYIKLIHEAIQNGQQVLYLLPEIALTTQIIDRLKHYFGAAIGVYHSRYNANEKVEIWNKVLSSEADKSYQIVIGPRSALFLPFTRLGLIIIDEEHDPSYKQVDPAPRYHARDAAIMHATSLGAKVLLGSDTPAFESYFNAQSGKYGYVTLTERYGKLQLPEITIVNLREEVRRKTIKSHFSAPLLTEIKHAHTNKEQVILFQNRRGFSLRLECDICHYVPQCRNCDVSLIYHKHQNMLRCHYCGFGMAVPSECPQCHSTSVKMHGFGTEKIEEELGLIMPELKIARLDLDTTRKKYGFQEILEAFGSGKTDVLVGTQMVTKGLDFDKVKIVGIMNADNMLSYPDFRAFERSFQLMAQVSGRAGRKNEQGKVIIQTYQPNHELLKFVMDNNYEMLYKQQLIIRKRFKYPPFYRLIEIKLSHRDQHLINRAAFELANELRKIFKNNLLGPEFPIVARIKNQYFKQILIKFPRNQSDTEVKSIIAEKLHLFHLNREFKSVRVFVNVDPQ
ncbi:MAG: primosomal protein N' [Bacteroidales bacterium]|nr:primosomal protein N' [Bacteroidales bacterium]